MNPNLQLELKLDDIAREIASIKQFQQKAMLSVDEAANYLGIRKSTLYKHTSTGNIPFYKPNGKLILFKRDELDDWIQSKRIPSNAELKGSVGCEASYGGMKSSCLKQAL